MGKYFFPDNIKFLTIILSYVNILINFGIIIYLTKTRYPISTHYTKIEERQ